MIDKAEEMQATYEPYVIKNERGSIVGVKDNITEEAKEALIEQLEINRRSDDISNAKYWEDWIDKVEAM